MRIDASILIRKTCPQRRLNREPYPAACPFGVGGMKLFRGLIYPMHGFMKADHRLCRQRGLYDFPKKKPGAIREKYLIGYLIRIQR